MSAPSADPSGDPGGRGDHNTPGLFAGHALAYAELATALLHAWQRSMARKALGVLLAVMGLVVFTLLLTVTVIAAAWSTPSRWLVVSIVAAVYLGVGLWGIWMLTRRPEVPEPMTVLATELRKDVTQLSAAFRESRQRSES